MTDLAGKLHTAQASEARWKAALDTEKHQSEQMKAFHREAESFVKKGEERGQNVGAFRGPVLLRLSCWRVARAHMCALFSKRGL